MLHAFCPIGFQVCTKRTVSTKEVPFLVSLDMISSSESISPSQNRSFPFTISAILSDEVGQKKSPPASCLNAPFSTPISNISSSKVPAYSMSSQASHQSSDTPKRPRKPSNFYVSTRTPKILHSEAGLMVPPSCQTYTNSELLSHVPLIIGVSTTLRGGSNILYTTSNIKIGLIHELPSVSLPLPPMFCICLVQYNI